MENKIYTLITAFFFCCLLSARAQDSASCTAAFQYYTSAGTAVSFRAQDTLPNIQHYWYFGDGNGTGFSRANSFVVHVYQQNGAYSVTHIIRDSTGGGCYDSIAQYVVVNAPPSCPVYLYIQGDSMVNSHIYSFYAGGAGVSDTIRWYINDSLVGTGDSLPARYLAAGHYTVCARLHTASGCSSSACQSIDVVSGCAVSPVINYSADSSDPQTVHFTVSPNNYTFYWTFGDGGSAFGSQPVHTYPYGGTYVVTVRLYGFDGTDSCTSYAYDTVHVTGRPTCNVPFTWSQNPAHPGLVTFNAQDSSATDSLLWVIWRPNAGPQDTVVLYGQHPTHAFIDSGCYSVTLFATTPAGCHGMTQQWVCMDTLSNGSNNFIAAYPNPAPGQTFLDVQLDEGHTININIFNSMGHLVLVRKEAGFAGMNHLSLPTASLPKGIYYVQVQYGGVTRRSKIQKL